MQNGRGSYRYTAASGQSSPGRNNNTAPGRSEPQGGSNGTGANGASQNRPARNGQNNINSVRSGAQAAGGQAGVNPALNRNAQNAGRGAQNPQPRASNTRGQNPSNPTPQGLQPSGTARQGNNGSRSLANRGETGVALPAEKKRGLIGYWKRVFALTPSEEKHNEVVPRIVEGYDYVFLIIVIVLLAFGSVMVYSASYAYAKTRYGDSYYIITRQAIFMAIGFVGMFIAMHVTPDLYKRFAPVIFLVCFFLLCLVPIPGIGVLKKGARRWLNIGIDFQPSEAMKFGIAAMLAWYFDRYQKRIQDYTNFWRASAFGVFFPYLIVGVTCFLIVLEKHLSGTVIMFLIGTIIIFAGGAMKRWIFGMFGGGGVALLLLGLFTDYTKRRFELWIHPEEYPQDGGWQILQGLYAIGSGGFFGVGIGESRLKHMYVPEPQNDFIFTIVCEELGFIGAVAVIALFMLFVYRGIVIAMRAPDTFSSLLVTGIVGKVAIQAILNIAVVTGSIPNTGISLPFFSYGGTSLCILMAEMGVVLSISRYSKQRK